jgi:hypothetical protein
MLVAILIVTALVIGLGLYIQDTFANRNILQPAPVRSNPDRIG